ncbi:DEAD/DEAH box helicase [Streptomyces sp. SLBN-31]|uniref:DEAD/DEAH box helicase n=1 Tax=Streptomyces sp. SLBN-31 TaxID=2768444 RepID=UPI0011509716|nr:AAA domain-containing protein [Streptomyces sp. SLBN-31]TQJ87862.1 AAA domain-containing protein [Streptomyces sp. SLBN-31]
MSFVTVDLPGPVMLVPGGSLDRQLRDKSQLHPGLPTSVTRIAHDLSALGSGVPARIEEGGRGTSLLLHTAAYKLRLYPTDRGTGYFLASVNPVRLRDHNELAGRCLLVRPPRWHLVPELREIPQGAEAGWDRLRQAWQRLGAVPAEHREAAVQNTAQSGFLDMIGQLVDATERITTREERRDGPYPYASVAATGGQRHTRRAAYAFRLAVAEAPQEGAFVEVRGMAEMRGQVTRADGGLVTVRFDRPVSWADIPRQGELSVTPTSVVFDKQREAVALLRTRESRNPRLLPALVEHQVREIRPAPVTPAEPLDADQLEAFRKALATDDVLVVLGPPGTGKTRTITQIAHACATGPAGGRPNDDANGRVLITSHTNRAVDNVLAKLPEDLVVVRVGNEGKVHEDGRAYLLDRQINDLAGVVQNAMALREERFAHLDIAGAWAVELTRELDRLGTLSAAVDSATSELHTARRAAGGPARQRLDGLSVRREVDQGEREKIAQAIAQASDKCRQAQERSGSRVLGRVFRGQARRWQRRLDELRGRDDELSSALAAADTATAEACQELERVTREDPAVRRALRIREQAAEDRTDCLGRARRAAERAVAAVAHLDSPPLPSPAPERDELRALNRWLERRLPLLTARRQLAAEWRTAITAEPEQLVPEFIRYAHVVGATCIGTASRPELSGVDFDLAIVDEAGQIGIADALVPLVRARRGVLVGDHKQLPPFLDSEVADWGKDIASAELRGLMAKSALERLVDGLPASHIVQLSVQRRMPVEIAGFVSSTFYGNLLRTEKDHVHHDPLFDSPIAFVDTGGLSAREREESSGRRAQESFGRAGVSNRCEARLLARLAAFYHGHGGDWTVIVPYRAQVAAVVAEVSQLIGDAQRAKASVGTVDSFQGGEREVILYGFTRSNAEGRIGFLKELRRANVAFTRAQRQLVLVGDLGTLLRADDPDFRALMHGLYEHLRSCGDIRASHDVMGRLAAHGGDGA